MVVFVPTFNAFLPALRLWDAIIPQAEQLVLASHLAKDWRFNESTCTKNIVIRNLWICESVNEVKPDIQVGGIALYYNSTSTL